MRRSPPTEQKKDAVREQAWWGRRWETNEAKQEQSSLGAPAMRSDQARVASSREDTGGVGGEETDSGCSTGDFVKRLVRGVARRYKHSNRQTPP